jgi:formylglycine-generating enzyme required for sulfatase activity
VNGEFDVRVAAGAQEIVRLTLAEKTKGLRNADALDLKWVRVPAGDFTMGCSPGDSECDDDEKPAHPVKITKPFEMTVTETTVVQFRKYAAASNTKMPEQATWSTDAHPVGLKKPNANGLYDVLGNVWEWTADWYSNIYYQGGASLNPVGPRTGEYRVLRGGSWDGASWDVRVSFRLGG